MSLTESELMGAVAATGRQLSARQLRRMRESRLLTSPEHVHEPGGAGGSRSFYPAAAVKRVCRIIDLLAVRRSHDFVLLSLWRDGESVSASRVRAILAKQFEQLQKQAREILDANEGDTFRFVDGFVRAAEDEGGSRRPLEPADRVTARNVVMLTTQGEQAGWDTPDEPGGQTPRELVERMHGIDALRNDIAACRFPAVTDADLEAIDVQREYETLRDSGAFNPVTIADDIAALSNSEIEQLPKAFRAHTAHLNDLQAQLPSGAATGEQLQTISNLFEPTSVADFASLVQFVLMSSRAAAIH